MFHNYLIEFEDLVGKVRAHYRDENTDHDDHDHDHEEEHLDHDEHTVHKREVHEVSVSRVRVIQSYVRWQ